MPSDPTGPFARQKSRCFNPRPAPRCRATALRALAAPLLVVSIRARHLDAERHARQFVGLHADQVSIRARHLDAERLCACCRFSPCRIVSIRARHLDAERPSANARAPAGRCFNPRPAPRCRATQCGKALNGLDSVSIRARHLDAERLPMAFSKAFMRSRFQSAPGT